MPPDPAHGQEGRHESPNQGAVQAGPITPRPDPRPQQVPIIVNGRQFTVPDDDVSFEEVVRLAFPSPDPCALFRVSYEKAAGPNTEGNLVAGQSVKVRKGTIFHVTPTDKS